MEACSVCLYIYSTIFNIVHFNPPNEIFVMVFEVIFGMFWMRNETENTNLVGFFCLNRNLIIEVEGSD